MTGLYDGIGTAILLSLFLWVFVPFMSLLLLKELGLFRSFNKTELRIFLQVLIFIFLAVITLLVLRSAPYVAMDWVFLFGLAETLTYLTLRFKRIRRQKR
jgi:hypothetical protein